MTLNQGTYYNPGVTTFSLTVQLNELGYLQLLAAWDVTYTLIDAGDKSNTETVQLIVELQDSADNVVATMYSSHGGRFLVRSSSGSKAIDVPTGSYKMVSRIVNLNEDPGASIVGDLVAVSQPSSDWFTKDYHKRIPTGRELTWYEGDENLDISDGRTQQNKASIEALLATIEPFLDDFFRVANAADPTKTVVFDLSGLDTGMSITLVMPRASGRVVVDGTTEDVTLNGDLVVYGNLIQQGVSFETEVETLKVADQVIILRDGAIAALPDGEYAGFWVEHYDTDGKRGGVVLDKNGMLRVGDEDDLQPVSTREETPTAQGIAFWNSTTLRWETAANFKYDGTRFIVERSTDALTPSSTVNVSWNAFAINTLSLTTDTTLAMTGDYYTGQAMYVIVDGDYLLKVDPANFEGDVLTGDGVVPNYLGNRKNLVQIFCTDADNDKFWIIVKATENVS